MNVSNEELFWDAFDDEDTAEMDRLVREHPHLSRELNEMFHEAVESMRFKMIRFFMSRGFKVDDNNQLGFTLHMAAANGRFEEAAFYLDHGVDVNYANEDGETAFSYTCANNQFEMAKFLVERGVEINTLDVGDATPLDWAICHASQAFRDWLISIGGKRNSTHEPWPPPEIRKEGWWEEGDGGACELDVPDE